MSQGHLPSGQNPKRVLILCTGNSARSQMAEALWRQAAGGRWLAFSAGTKPSGYVHPGAIRAMQEIGVDISAQRSKHVDELSAEPFDLVVTVCDNAHEVCPIFPNAREQLHWPFDDPAAVTVSDEEQLAAFRRVRDEIAAAIQRFL